jgi:hypothetical protein
MLTTFWWGLQLATKVKSQYKIAALNGRCCANMPPLSRRNFADGPQIHLMTTPASPSPPAPEPASGLHQISTNFRMTMYAIRTLADNVAPLADERDRDALQHLIQGIASALDVNVATPAMNADPESSSNSASVPETNSVADQALIDAPKAFARLLNNAHIYARTDPRKMWQLWKHLDSCVKRMPAAHLLRSGLLITLVSHLDALIAALIRSFYRVHPEALPAQESSITLEELRNLGSVAAAEDHILERLVNSRLYESFSDQLKFFTNRLSVKMSCLDEYLGYIVETIQRRHVHVHNAGIANRQYTSKVSAELQTEYDVRDETYLMVDAKYLRRAIDRIHMAGLLLIQQCWRQWHPIEREKADRELNSHIYDTIIEERYVLAQNLGKYATTVKYATDKDRQYAILNLAQAYKWNQQPTRATEVLSSNDWSGSSLLVQLAISALNDEEKRFFTLLPRVLAAEEIDIQSLHEWPMFKKMRSSPQFPPKPGAPSASMGAN